MAQQKQIENEIAENIPLVGNLVSLDQIYSEYAEDDVIYRNKIRVIY